MLIDDAAEKGQSHAALAGLARAAALGYDRAAAGARRLPAARPGGARRARARGRADADVVIVPDRHGTGTNALVLDPRGPVRAAVRPGLAASATSSRRERRGLSLRGRDGRRRSRSTSTPATTSPRCARRSSDSHGRAPRTRGVLRQIERTQLAAVAA